MATDFDAYRTLGLERSAPPALVDAAYEQMRLRHRDEPQTLSDIETAYQLLRDPEQRRSYDTRHPSEPAPSLEFVGQSVPTAAAPVSGAGGTVPQVPWTLGDIARALVLPMLFVAMNVAAGFTMDIDEDDLTTTDYVVNFGFGLLVEGAFFAFAYWFTVRKYKVGWSALGFRKPTNVPFWFPFALVAMAFGIIWTYAIIIYALGVTNESNLPDGSFDEPIRVVMLALLAILVAPIVEETFFRGFLFQGFATRFGPWPAIALSALIFGSVHLSTPESLLTFLPISAIGAIFAWGVWRSGSLYPSIIAHLIFNGTTVVVGIIEASS